MGQAGWEKAGWAKAEPARARGGANARLLREFLASGGECIGKDMGDERKATSKRNSLMETVKRNEEFQGKVKVSKRGTMVYLLRL